MLLNQQRPQNAPTAEGKTNTAWEGEDCGSSDLAAKERRFDDDSDQRCHPSDRKGDRQGYRGTQSARRRFRTITLEAPALRRV